MRIDPATAAGLVAIIAWVLVVLGALSEGPALL